MRAERSMKIFPQRKSWYPDCSFLEWKFALTINRILFAFEIFYSLATIYSGVTNFVLISNFCLMVRPSQIMSWYSSGSKNTVTIPTPHVLFVCSFFTSTNSFPEGCEGSTCYFTLLKQELLIQPSSSCWRYNESVGKWHLNSFNSSIQTLEKIKAL